jgi:mannose-1-phosphate guanylyltransferase
VPELFRALSPLGSSKRLARAKLREVYQRAPSEPIDTAVLERSRRVWTLPVDFHWSDVGTWESLAEELGVAAGTTRVVEGDVVYDDLGGNLIWVPSVTGVTGRTRRKGDKQERGRAVALLGVEGLAVIDTGDALLIARLDRAADVRDVVKQSKARGRTDVT